MLKFRFSNLSSKIKTRIKSTIEKSTSHGIPKIVEHDNWLIKVIWIIFTLISAGLCAFLIVENIIGYFKYEVTTKIRVVNDYNATFPSVTICNNAHLTTDYAAQFIKNASLSRQNDSIQRFNQYLFQKLYQIANDTEELKKIGDSLEKLIPFYSYNLLRVNNLSDEFRFIFHPFFGNCFTFNSAKYDNGSHKSAKKTFKRGFYSGLYLELNVSISKNILLFPGRGGVIFIHEFGTSPLTASPISVIPKYDFQIVLRRIKSTKLPKPYSDCTENTDDVNSYDSEYFKYVHKSSYKYSQKLCFDVCFHMSMLKQCSCYIRQLSLSEGGEPCLKEKDFQCAFKFYTEFLNSDSFNQLCLPNCPLECNSMVFTTTTSMLLKNFENESYNDICSVRVKYEDFTQTEIEESAVIDTASLLSNIGGIAGLFLGISVLSFVEILAIFIEVFELLFKRQKSFNNLMPFTQRNPRKNNFL